MSFDELQNKFDKILEDAGLLSVPLYIQLMNYIIKESSDKLSDVAQMMYEA